MRRRRPSRRGVLLAASVLVGVVGAVVLIGGLDDAAARRVPPVAASAPAGPTTAAPAASAAAAPSSVPPARYTPSSPLRIAVPAVGLDLPLLAMAPRGGAIDPPLLTAAYWIEPYGAPAGSAAEADNTLYVAAHSAGYGRDGFDPLLAGEGSALATGDVVEVRTPRGTVEYVVEDVRRYGKDELPGAAEVWAASPGRLVLITCFQRADGREATENLVVVAEAR